MVTRCSLHSFDTAEWESAFSGTGLPGSAGVSRAFSEFAAVPAALPGDTPLNLQRRQR
jgi:hypothetical protein